MKKTLKALTTLLLLLTLITAISPLTPVPQPEDNEPGITVQGIDEDDTEDNIIERY